ncbi:hypothetical protein CK228_09180 [Mesorhizobium sp. WSM4312]|uniref:hypothetical protein n=1 Tax=unclassified Mesorhizobium TaxID=325217 RepID=UPI000BAF4051|nr:MULTISPECIES: hypothetical protein [unclassified Mesorhizobium]PBB24613.1 hypothetical protein CK232_20480 [Mesorhizobium sp. WSM4304]PBB68707.1 hypothetical protein CK228_09180 [Mesorhizobium sp. WSM4312]PBB73912.1 hypothetical protein CK227_17820 [Mesorhizobium sp. WSM4308]PBC24377.1 hypothetical protein CK226_00370 [Mesorhizobium sp. WSM4311]TRC72790.1 hypothetical protein FJV81_27305 [Mesorhizobium sp. WSM4315]
MRYDYSMRLHDDVNAAVERAFKTAGIVNITVTAEQVRIMNLAENVALEDIEYLVLRAAQLLGAAIEFDSMSSGLALSGNVEGEERAISPLVLSQPASIQ